MLKIKKEENAEIYNISVPRLLFYIAITNSSNCREHRDETQELSP